MFPAPMRFFFSSRRRHTRSVSAFLLNRSSDLASRLTKLGYDATPFNQILKQNAKREMRLRLGKVRSEERRVGKECSSLGSAPHEKKKNPVSLLPHVPKIVFDLSALLRVLVQEP